MTEKTFPGVEMKDEELKCLIDRFAGLEIVAEIGCYAGKTTLELAKVCNKVIAVDFFEFAEDNSRDNEKDEVKDIFLRRIKDKNILFFEMKSEEAVKLIDDLSLDAVFIDAAHDYENVKKDLSWINKVKIGGLVAFHDTIWPEYDVGKVLKKYLEENPGKLELVDSAVSLKIYRRLR